METDARTPTGSVERRDRLGVGEGNGGRGVREGVGGKNNGLRPVWEWTLARVGAGARHRVLGFRQGGERVGAKMESVWP